MVGSRMASAMMYGIIRPSRSPHRLPKADQRGERLAAAPSKMAGSTSTHSTQTYAITQTATSSRAELRFHQGTMGRTAAFQ